MCDCVREAKKKPLISRHWSTFYFNCSDMHIMCEIYIVTYPAHDQSDGVDTSFGAKFGLIPV